MVVSNRAAGLLPRRALGSRAGGRRGEPRRAREGIIIPTAAATTTTTTTTTTATTNNNNNNNI